MIIEVTKQQVLDAILHEPIKRLKSGHWLEEPAGRGKTLDLGDCPRCAVGAFLCTVVEERGVDDAASAATRGSSIVPDPPRDVDDHQDQAWVDSVLKDYLSGVVEDAAEIVERSPMAALSFIFEGSVMAEAARETRPGDDPSITTAGMLRARDHVTAFVQTYFPEICRIDVDGATLRPGVVAWAQE